MPRPLLVLFAAALALAAGGPAHADDRIDAASGRDLAVYPPARHFDHLHMRLEIDIPDMGKPFLTATETLRVAAVGKARSELVVNAHDQIKVESVRVRGRRCEFERDGDRLTVRLDRPASPREPIDVVFTFSVEYPKADGSGLTWTAGRESARSLTDRAAQIHSQGQPESNRQWFIGHDFPNDRLTTELIVTVEDPYIVGSNGRLIGTRFAGNRDGRTRTTWHWLQDKPHCVYLVCMVVGRFEIVGLGAERGEEPRNASGEPLAVYLYAPHGTAETARRAYRATPAMVNFFARVFDEPYPWDRYAQALVRRFAAGGMENTTITTMQAGSARARAGSQDDIIAHELCHQWMGDLLTCNGWEHLWLNEGWASYGEALWAEAAGGAQKKRAYQRKIASFVSTQRVLNRTYAPDFPPMVSNRYARPFDNFIKPNDVYAKGACVLHMLRQMLGDEAFFAGVRLYIDRHRFGLVETDQFRRALEEVSGLSLERFFAQWCYRPGLPQLEIETEWTPAESGGGELGITVRQKQRIDADNPAYAFELPVVLKDEDGDRTVRLDVGTREVREVFTLDAKPEDIVVDPEMTVVAVTRVKKPLAMWLRQAEDASVFAQWQAAEHLAEFDDPAAAAALARMSVDPARAEVVRAAAAAGLAGRYRRTLEHLLGVPPPVTEDPGETIVRADQGASR